MSNIIIPFPNNQNFKLYIENQIDGFLIGIDGFSENFNNLVSATKLKRTIESIKNINKTVYIMLNKVYFNEKIEDLKRVLSKINKIGVDAVFFSDMAVFNIVKEKKYNINLIWQSKMATNSKTLNFLKKRGLYGFSYTPQITLDEYFLIEKKSKLPSFVKLFGYTNMATSSRNLVSNYFKFTKLKNDPSEKYFMYDKITKEYYPIIEKDNTNFFSSKILNGILEYKKILNKNIDATIILDDYLIEENSFYNVIEAFVALKNHSEDNDFAIKLKKVIESNIFEQSDDGFFYKKTIFKVKNNE